MANNITLESININPDSFNIPTSTLESMEKHLFNSSIQDLIKTTNENLSDIQIIAKNYLIILTNGFLKLQQLFLKQHFDKSVYQKVIAARKGAGLEFARMEMDYKESLNALASYMRTIAIQTEKLSIAFQLELGLQSEILYIPDAENPVIYKIKNIEDLLHTGLDSSWLRQSSDTMKQMANDINKQVSLVNNSKMLGLQQASYLQTAYSKIIERYNKYKYNSKSGNGVISIIMWNMKSSVPSNAWLAMRVLNKGDLAQTYANIVFQRKSIFSGIQSPEYDINAFMWRVTEVDSVSGLLQGDFIIGNKSYAVKSGDASTQGFTKAIQTAELILKETDPNNIRAVLQRQQHNLGYIQKGSKEGQRRGLRNWVKYVGNKTLSEAFGYQVTRV